jgi:DNA-binding protein YbaB
MFPDLEAQQQKIKEQLALQIVEGSAGDGTIIVIANAIPEIKSIKVDRSKIDLSQEEQLEDLLIIAINEALANAQEQQAIISQAAISEMLPPGLGNLKSLFGG